jgi:hypothetical protein
MGILEILGIIFLFLLFSFIGWAFLVIVYVSHLNNNFKNDLSENYGEDKTTKPF